MPLRLWLVAVIVVVVGSGFDWVGVGDCCFVWLRVVCGCARGDVEYDAGKGEAYA